MEEPYKTRVTAFDVFGTMLSTIGENFPARRGLGELLFRLKNAQIIICTCSDAKTLDVQNYLKRAGVNIEDFDNFFSMPRERKEFIKQPKKLEIILDYYSKKIGLIPRELLIIGDRKERDIAPAQRLGCNAIKVPEYYDMNQGYDFNINSVKIP